MQETSLFFVENPLLKPCNLAEWFIILLIIKKIPRGTVATGDFPKIESFFYGVSLARVTNKVNPTTPSYSDAPKNGEARNTAATKTAAEANPA